MFNLHLQDLRKLKTSALLSEKETLSVLGGQSNSKKSFNDKIDGGRGNDKICSGPGNDTIRGGSGNDTIYGGSGNDVIRG
jgi:Ca2+-binding RTX toxin-like protein